MKEISSKSKNIAKAILFAQLASDGGKEIDDLIDEVRCKGAWDCFRRGYASKSAHILKALDLINRQRSEEVKYSVIYTPDQNGYPSILTYFTFRLNGRRRQVSFHTPALEGLLDFRRYFEKSSKTHWDPSIPSRQECLDLAERFGWV